MSFKIKPNQKFSFQIRQRAQDQCDAIEDAFQKSKIMDQDMIYKIRTRLKEVRMLLRLVRPKTGSKFYGRENQRLREIAGQLSLVRDTEVELKLLDGLERGLLNPAARRKVLQLQAALDRKHTVALSKIHDQRKEIQSAIARAGNRIKKWPLKNLKKSDFKSGLARAVRRQQEAFNQAWRSPNISHLHEWRKRAKDAGYMLSVLQTLLPARKKQRIFEQLARYLGADHDLALLEKTIGRKHKSRHLVDTLSRRRTKLQRSAFDLARAGRLNDQSHRSRTKHSQHEP